MSNQSVWVCCAASNAVSTEIKTKTKNLGKFLAKNKIKTIHGGGSTGLMRALSDGVKAEKGEELGIMTKQVEKLELPNPDYAHMSVDTFFERKKLLMEKSDAYIFTTGGVGTLDELFEALVLNKVGVENKPIIIHDPTKTQDFAKMIRYILNKCVKLKTSGPANIIYTKNLTELKKVLV